jgi:hypothetical protein
MIAGYSIRKDHGDKKVLEEGRPLGNNPMAS